MMDYDDDYGLEIHTHIHTSMTRLDKGVVGPGSGERKPLEGREMEGQRTRDLPFFLFFILHASATAFWMDCFLIGLERWQGQGMLASYAYIPFLLTRRKKRRWRR